MECISCCFSSLSTFELLRICSQLKSFSCCALCIGRQRWITLLHFPYVTWKWRKWGQCFRRCCHLLGTWIICCWNLLDNVRQISIIIVCTRDCSYSRHHWLSLIRITYDDCPKIQCTLTTSTIMINMSFLYSFHILNIIHLFLKNFDFCNICNFCNFYNFCKFIKISIF